MAKNFTSPSLLLTVSHVVLKISFECRREQLGSVGHAGRPVKPNEECREGLTQRLQSLREDRRVWRIEIFHRHRWPVP